MLDIDGCDEKSKDAANAIDFSLQKIDSPYVKLSGTTTDSGGGGVTFSLARELNSLGRIESKHLIGRCAIHGIQLVLGNAVKNQWEKEA